MNICEIFCHGDGRIDEPNMSSVLAFLLDPGRPHGFSRAFLGEFLEPFRTDIEGWGIWKRIQAANGEETMREAITGFGDIVVNLEEGLWSNVKDSNRKSRYLDVVIRMYEKKSRRLLFAIAVENKIRDEAAQTEQLQDEYDLLRTAINDEGDAELPGKTVPILFVYLTPTPLSDCSNGPRKSWDELKLAEYLNPRTLDRAADACQDIKKSYAWKGTKRMVNEKSLDIGRKDETPTISALSRRMLDYEHQGIVSPASSHAGLLLRSLIQFINNDFRVASSDFLDSNSSNDMTVMHEDEFWPQWPNGKENTKQLAKDVFSLVQSVLENKDRDIRDANRQILIRYSTTRISFNLPIREETNDINRRRLTNPIVRIRHDGSTSGSRLHLEFERRPSIEDPAAIFSCLERETIGNLAIRSNPGRTLFNLLIPHDIPQDALGYFVRAAASEAIESVICCLPSRAKAASFVG